MDKPKKKWYKRWWAILIWIILGLAILGALFGEDTTTTGTTPPAQTQEDKPKETPTTTQTPTPTTTTVKKPEYDLEMSMEEIVNEFSDLSELQQKEKSKELKGKRIKTSIYASEIDKASLSTQYVVKEMYEYPYNLIAYAKAFFPAEEKDNLLKVNIGDTIIFSGEFVSFRESGLTSGTIEFTKSRFIEVEHQANGITGQSEGISKQEALNNCYKRAKECSEGILEIELELKSACMDLYTWTEGSSEIVDFADGMC